MEITKSNRFNDFDYSVQPFIAQDNPFFYDTKQCHKCFGVGFFNNGKTENPIQHELNNGNVCPRCLGTGRIPK